MEANASEYNGIIVLLSIAYSIYTYYMVNFIVIVLKLWGGKSMHIEHIAMYVNDLEKARDFFIQYFNATSNEGYHNMNTNFRSYFLSFSDGARLEIMNQPQMKDDVKTLNHTGYIHIAFSLGSKKAVDELTEKMQNDGYPVASGPRITGDGYYESCIIGFEGNQIEITE